VNVDVIATHYTQAYANAIVALIAVVLQAVEQQFIPTAVATQAAMTQRRTLREEFN